MEISKEEHDPGLISQTSRPSEDHQPRVQDQFNEDSNADVSTTMRHHPQEFDSNSSSESEPETDSSEFDDDDDDSYPDESLGSTIIREIQDGTYICLVCTGEIDPHSTIWSCQHCFRVYDLECIKDWAIRGSSTRNKEWRCPSCNVSTRTLPRKFTCWCGKVTNPTSGSSLEGIPFSCGDSCGYKYPDCVHACMNACHPGKHPVCGAMGPLMKCDCGREARQLPCLITPYEDGWRCENECEVTRLCDFGHGCPKGCHGGFCGMCEKMVEMRCYCGGEVLELKCYEKVLKRCQDVDGKEWIGGGECHKTHRLYYDCNEHYEILQCQPPSPTIPKCKFSPEVISTCYCGKTKVDSSNRTKCTDPVPECSQICGKLLPCGCHCQYKCHKGDCECTTIQEIKCQCGHETYLAPCKFIQSGQKPKCEHKCTVLLNCRKHYHREPCCEYEQAGLAREREKKKAIRNNLRSNFEDDIMSMEAVHICTRPCNRLKACGKHECQALCHNGPCEVCLESTNDDLVCHCGKTIIQAPVRCGTKLVCHEQCNRIPVCGHRAEIHECHDETVECPKCTALVTKECDCGTNPKIPGILCSQERVSCGRMCPVLKSCGHLCMRTCSAKCTKENQHAETNACQSYCRKVRNNCPHLCKQKCHFDKPGKNPVCDVVRCTEEVTLTCECGKLTKKVKCGATTQEPTAIGTIWECNEICAAAKRDAALRAAFDVNTTEKTQDTTIPYSESVMNTYKKQATLCSRIESTIRGFIQDYNLQVENDISSPKRSYHFPPMSVPQRQFVHELAETFKLYCESQDQEPRRSVFILITKLTIIPEMTLAEAAEVQEELEAQAAKVTELKQQDIDDALYNALVIEDVFFGVVKDDIENVLMPIVEKTKIGNPVFQWIKESTFVFYSRDSYKLIDIEEENKLYLLQKQFRQVLREQSLAFDCKLCLIDESTSYILKKDAPSRSEPKEAPKVAPKFFNGYELLQNDELSTEA